MVPPISRSPATTARWSAIVEITGCGVSGSNSVEFAPVSPAMLRAASITMHCRPRHSPSAGMAFVRAWRRASIFPSIPRMPKPPGTSTPSTPSSADAVLSGDEQESEGTQRISTRVFTANPPARNASVTDR